MQHLLPKPSHVMRFGVFEADLFSGELRKSGIRVKIQDLPFRALKLLLTHPNEVLSRERFRQELWPEGVFVDFDHGISSAINRVRDALGDSADNPLFIETVERRGYRWIAPTQLVEPRVAESPRVQPGPVLVQPVVAPEAPAPVSEAKGNSQSGPSSAWRWSLVFPAAAILLALWILWPSYRAAKAGTRKIIPAAPMVLHHAANPEAEQYYLQGRFYWQERTPEALNKAVDAFTQAIVLDANYAPAYVGLADCYNLLREYTAMPPSEAYPRALAAARKAVELDEQSSEAHTSLAFALYYGNWDSAGAEREFRRAIALDPNNARAHHWYATYLSTTGRNPDSLVEIDCAQALDPSSKAILADKGDLLFLAGRREEAIDLLKQMASTEPDFISPHRYLAVIYLAAGDYPNYLAEWRKQATLMKDASTLKLVEAAEQGYAAGGVHAMLENILAVQKRLYEHGAISAYSVAQSYALLGKHKEAMQYLQAAYDAHDEMMMGLRNDGDFQSVRPDPAFTDLVARVSAPAKN
jgi:DNA-binding winged helix-turn-helix (wHTH) protein/tetratricopeptide (TPR) repeat protein